MPSPIQAKALLVTRHAIVEQQDEHEIFVEEVDLVLDGVLVHGLQDHMAGAVGSITGAAYRTFAEVAGMSTETALVDATIGSTVKGQAAMFQFVDGIDSFTGQDFRRWLINEIIATLDGIVHVPLPVVFFHVAQRSSHATLSRASMRTRRVD